MGKATTAEWAKLYEQATKVKEIKPWEYFSFLDTITIKLPEREMMYYVSIDDHYMLISINILRDAAAYSKFIETYLNTELTELESFNIISDIDVFSMCIGERKSVPQSQLKIIKELGLTFRGKQDWIFFLSKRKGYAPNDLDQKEVLFMTECLEQIYKATEHYLRKQIDINFDDGYSLCRYYNDDEKKWLTFEKKVNLEKVKIEYFTYSNEIQLQKIKRLPATDLELEFDITYIQSTVKEGNKKAIARLLLIANKNQGALMMYKVLLPSDDIYVEAFAALYQVIERYGKIKKIFYKSDLCEGIIYDFCSKAGINVHRDNYLPVISNFLEKGLEEN